MSRISFMKAMTIFLILTIGLLVVGKYINNHLISNDAPEVKNKGAEQNIAINHCKDSEIKVLASEKQQIAAQVKEKNEKELKNEKNREELEQQIKDYLGDNIEHIGLSYFDINSRKSIKINGDKVFIAASTIKVQMNMILCDMFKSGQIAQEEALEFTEDCYEEGTGVLQGQNLSKPLKIKLLSEYSITHSDNIATNMIIKRIGYKTMRDLIDGKLGHTTDHTRNYITANDETALLKLLYDNVDNNPFYAQIIENMKKTDFHDRIDLYIPQEVVAHKIGNYDSYVNDVGIIHVKKPYILSIYTKELPYANEVIAHISKMIYDYQNRIS